MLAIGSEGMLGPAHCRVVLKEWDVPEAPDSHRIVELPGISLAPGGIGIQREACLDPRGQRSCTYLAPTGTKTHKANSGTRLLWLGLQRGCRGEVPLTNGLPLRCPGRPLVQSGVVPFRG